jgi:hypothetical protein
MAVKYLEKYYLKKYLVKKYDFKKERLFENKAGYEKITDKQINLIYSLLKESKTNNMTINEVLKLFSLCNLAYTIESLLKSQAMFLLNQFFLWEGFSRIGKKDNNRSVKL